MKLCAMKMKCQEISDLKLTFFEIFKFKFTRFDTLKKNFGIDQNFDIDKKTPSSTSKKVKVTKNVIGFFFRKWNLTFRFTSGAKNLPNDPVFSNWVNFIKKMSIIKCS